jgi:hypothetical protein
MRFLDQHDDEDQVPMEAMGQVDSWWVQREEGV